MNLIINILKMHCSSPSVSKKKKIFLVCNIECLNFLIAHLVQNTTKKISKKYSEVGEVIEWTLRDRILLYYLNCKL